MQVFSATLVKVQFSERFGLLAVPTAPSYIDQKLQDKKELVSGAYMKANDPPTQPKEPLEEPQRYAFRMVFEKVVITLQEHNVLKKPANSDLQVICL